MDNNKIKSILLQFVKAENESDVVKILKSNNFYENEPCWRNFGDIENNFSTIGNQQTLPEVALVEKLINSVDSVLTKQCIVNGIDPESSKAPKTINKAVELFYNIPNGKLTNITPTERTKFASDNIGIVCTGNIPKEGNPSYIIFDLGEGQAPSRIPDTFMSIGANNKIKIPFVQGKFNMGGTGVFRFSPKDACQLLLTKRNPSIHNDDDPEDRDKWGFTLIRKIPPRGGMKSSKYVYLVNPKNNLPFSFESDELNILPGNYPEKYTKPMKYGSFIKLYEYQITSYKTIMILDLYNRLSLLMPSLALPIRMFERRNNYRANSYESTLNGLSVRLEEDKLSNLESEEWPATEKMNIKGEEFKIKIYAFKNKIENKKRKNTTSNYTKSEGIIFTVNGQTHGNINRRFFKRKNVALDLISDSIIVMVDASEIAGEMKEELFMNSRDRLVDSGDLRTEIDKKLTQILANHKGLKELKNKRYHEQIEDKIGDSKPLQEVIEQIMKSSPSLSKIFISGSKLSNPMDLRPADQKNDFFGKKFPSFFKITKDYTIDRPRKFPINQSSIRIEFKTDVFNDYFDREIDKGEHKLFLNEKEFLGSSSIGLWNGTATLNVYPTEKLKVGDIISFRSEIQDITHLEPLTNEFIVCVDKEIAKNKSKSSSRKKPQGDNPGKDQTSSGIDLPKVIKVKKNDDNWLNREFDDYTALDVDYAGDEKGYIFYLNMHNLHLGHHIKENKKNDPEILKSQYEYANSLIALSIIQFVKEKNLKLEEDAEETELIKRATRCISMILLPMISYLGAIPIDND